MMRSFSLRSRAVGQEGRAPGSDMRWPSRGPAANRTFPSSSATAAIRGDACHLALEYGQCFGFRHVLRGIKGQHGGAARKKYPSTVKCQIVRSFDFQHEFRGLERLIGPDGAVHWRQRDRRVAGAAEAVERPS
jgi:hypothetical protein